MDVRAVRWEVEVQGIRIRLQSSSCVPDPMSGRRVPPILQTRAVGRRVSRGGLTGQSTTKVRRSRMRRSAAQSAFTGTDTEDALDQLYAPAALQRQHHAVNVPYKRSPSRPARRPYCWPLAVGTPARERGKGIFEIEIDEWGDAASSAGAEGRPAPIVLLWASVRSRSHKGMRGTEGAWCPD